MRSMLGLSMLALFAAAGPALAAEGETEEIVVTASRTPTPANQLPAAITVIDVAAARARGEFTLSAALTQTPGLQIPSAGPVGQQASIFSGGFESNHTLVLFDGVRIDDPSTPEGVFDAGQDTLGDATRVEIVQGPLSALYGSNALGGVVNILPRRGGAGAFNPRLEVASGSFDAIIGAVGANGAIGRLGYAMSAEAYASNGYDIVPKRIAAYTGEADGSESTLVTAIFDYAATSDFAFDALFRRRDARADYDPGLFGDVGENPDAEIRENDTALWRLGASWSPDAAHSIRVSGGALETDRVFADAGLVGDEYHGVRRFADAVAARRTNTWTLQFGATAESEEITAASFGAQIAGEHDHWGAFAAAQGRMGALNFTAALRHDDHRGFGGHTTWRAGAAYAPGAMRAYVALGTAYRAPSLYERFVPVFGAADLEPEEARSFELGAEARLDGFGRTDAIELGALHRLSEIDDLIGFLGFAYANVDRAEIAYTEARLALRPLDWLTVRATYANTDARDASTSQALQRRPRHAWSAEVGIERGPLTAQVSWRLVGARLDTLYDDVGAFVGVGRTPAYDIVRASASWALSDGLKTYAAADNLLGEVYEPVNGFAGSPTSLMIGVRITP